MTPSESLLKLSLEPIEEASAAARRRLRDVLADDPRLDDLLLTTSELIANALRHADLSRESKIDIEVQRVDARLRVQVAYRGRPYRPNVRSAPDAAGGYGLLIIDNLSDTWNVSTVGEMTSTRVDI